MVTDCTVIFRWDSYFGWFIKIFDFIDFFIFKTRFCYLDVVALYVCECGVDIIINVVPNCEVGFRLTFDKIKEVVLQKCSNLAVKVYKFFVVRDIFYWELVNLLGRFNVDWFVADVDGRENDFSWVDVFIPCWFWFTVWVFVVRPIR